MKKINLFAVMMMAVCSVNAQYGYWYHSKFIELTPEETSYYYVQPTNKVSNDESKRLLVDIEKSYRVLSHIGEEGRVVDAPQKPDDEKMFVSYHYRTKQNGGMMIMPEISLRMKEGYGIDKILKKYGDSLYLSFNEKDRYILQCNVQSSEEVLELVMKVHDEEGVKWCEPVMLSSITTCNTYYPQQYYLNGSGACSIKAEPAWTMIPSGSPNVKVAVIDSGVDDDHEDMGLYVLPGYTVDDEISRGRPKNANSVNLKGHGTCCAGIISAADNAIGIKGIAPSTSILPINIYPNEAYDYPNHYEGQASTTKIAAAIRWAYPRADILNCAWMIDESHDIEDALIEAMTDGRGGMGCIVIASAGNDYDGTQHEVAFPASIDGVIAVGGIMPNGSPRYDSRRYDGLDMVAFAQDVLTIDRMDSLGYVLGNYFYMSGTSIACSLVSGVAALTLAANSNLTGSQVRNILISSCQKSFGNQTITQGWYYTLGYGLVDAEKSVFKAAQLGISGSTVPENPSVYSVTGLGTATYPVTWSWKTPCSIPIVQNSPSTNQCTISNPNKDYINNVLVATITYDIETSRTVEKVIHTGANFSGTYSQEGGQVVVPFGSPIYHDPIPTTPFADQSYVRVHTVQTFTLTSSMFSSSTLTSEDGSFPTGWNQNGNTITYNYPRLGGPSIPVIGRSNTGYDVYKFTVKVIPDLIDPGLPILSPGNGTLTISLGDEQSEDGNSRSTETDLDELVWDVEIVNVLTGDIAYKGSFKGRSQTISTNGWTSGFYVVHIDINGVSISKKIYIK